MSGGAQAGSTGGAPGAALQNYPAVANSPGGAQASAAGAAPQAQSLSQLQQALQKLGAKGAQGQQSPAMQMGGVGQQMMQQGMQQQRPPQMMQRPMQQGQPMQSPQTPQMANPSMTGGMGAQSGGGMNVSQLNQILARQNGLMG